MSGVLLALRGVKQVYDGRTVLDIPQLDIMRGTFLALVGPNGSGKSTLLRMLALLEAPRSGEIIYCGRAVTPEQDAALRRSITLLPQEAFLLARTVERNLTYGLRLRGEKNAVFLRREAERALTLVGMDPAIFLRRRWSALSGGERQKVALAARLALRPAVLLLDEPTASLDEAGAVQAGKAIEAARRESGMTLVTASHDLEWLMPLCDETVRLRHGVPVDADL